MNPEVAGMAGVGVAIGVYILKRYIFKGLAGRSTHAVVFGISLVVAYFLPHTGLEGLLVTAGAVYAAALGARQTFKKTP